MKNTHTVDYSKEHKIYLRNEKNKKLLVYFAQIVILILLFALWEILTKHNILDVFFFSSPTRVLKTITSLYKNGELFYHMKITLEETLIAFILATGMGFIIAFVLWLSEYTRKISEPYLVVLNSLPKVALGPIIIIWMGAGKNAIITMAILIVIIVTIMSVLNSFLSCDKDMILLCKSLGANKLQTFFKVVLPNSLPDIVTIFKINIGLSWIGAIMGEYLVSRAGLGYLLIYGSQVFNLDLVITSTFLLCTLASIMYFAVSLFEKFVNSQRTQSRT